MQHIALLTESFPFPAGEQFLEAEMPFWARADARLVVFPTRAAGECPRTLPLNATLDSRLARRPRPVELLVTGVRTVASRMFRAELIALAKSRTLSAGALVHLCRKAVRVQMLTYRLVDASRHHGQFDVIYSYWNDAASYAAVLSRRGDAATPVIARAHGFDVYEELRPGHYMPFKRQLGVLVDLICPVSEAAKEYMVRTYGLDPDRLNVQRLGVQIPDTLAAPSQEGGLRIVSVSSCRPVKQVDKIVDMIAELGGLSGVRIHWTHIGGGPGLKEVSDYARLRFQSSLNVTWELTGHLPHDEVRHRLATGDFDLIVNLSRSEGVPVSLMEAMSCGIPPVATNVGGVSELVDEDCGRLLDATVSAREFAVAVWEFAVHAKATAVRECARTRVRARYDAGANYPMFIAIVRGMQRGACPSSTQSSSTPRSGR